MQHSTSTPVLTKRFVWRSDPDANPDAKAETTLLRSESSYDLATWYSYTLDQPGSLDDILSLLQGLQDRPHSCIVNGLPILDAWAPGAVGRRKKGGDAPTIHRDRKTSWLILDADSVPVSVAQGEQHNAAAVGMAIVDYWVERGMVELAGADFVAALTGSHGIKAGARARLIFQLEAPTHLSHLSRWARWRKRTDVAPEMDVSIFSANQPVYTARPILEFQDGLQERYAEWVAELNRCRVALVRPGGGGGGRVRIPEIPVEYQLRAATAAQGAGGGAGVGAGENGDFSHQVVRTWNAEKPLAEVLEEYGYTFAYADGGSAGGGRDEGEGGKGGEAEYEERWVWLNDPDVAPGLLVSPSAGKCWSFYDGDPLNEEDPDGQQRPRDSFDVMRLHDCDGDWARAFAHAERELGLVKSAADVFRPVAPAMGDGAGNGTGGGAGDGAEGGGEGRDGGVIEPVSLETLMIRLSEIPHEDVLGILRLGREAAEAGLPDATIGQLLTAAWGHAKTGGAEYHSFRRDWKRVVRAVQRGGGAGGAGAGVDNNANCPPGGAGAGPGGAGARLLEKGWVGPTTNEEGRPLKTLYNVAGLLMHEADWIEVLAADEFRGGEVIKRNDALGGTLREGVWSDDDTSSVRLWLESQWDLCVGKDLALDGVQWAASRYPVHPVRDWLESLRWDGTRRLEMMLPAYFKAAEDYSGTVGVLFAIGAVARIYEPGVKVDTVLVADGPQGHKKSTGFEVLFGRDYYFDSHLDLRSKDAYQALLGNWCIELAELASLRKSEIEQIKAFFSSRVDKYRPSYGRHMVEVGRQCVFVGTGNDNSYLRDITGNRRYLPFTVTSRVDVLALARDREQLWAEAVHLYKGGYKWWVDPQDPVAAALEEGQRKRTEEPPLAAVLREWSEARVRSPNPVTMPEVLNVLELAPNQLTSPTVLRSVSNALTYLGWSKKHTERGNLWIFETRWSL